MTLVDALILGLVQGLTEFLPVSSSGHLVLMEHWLGVTGNDLSFEIAVHLGTLIAVLIYFRSPVATMARSIWPGAAESERQRTGRNRLIAVIIGTIPAVIVGFSFKSQIAGVFDSPRVAAFFLIVTGVWLLSMRFHPAITGRLTRPKAIVIGIAQAAAILPGISRSGSTIATGVMLGVEPSDAAEFSFLLSIPAILGASVLEFPDAMAQGHLGWTDAVGAAAAGLVGYIALRWVFASLRRGRFIWFGVYCLILGTVTTLSMM